MIASVRNRRPAQPRPVTIVAIDDDDQIHFSILPGPVAKNRHLLDRMVA
jgi:hypothetical protein